MIPNNLVSAAELGTLIGINSRAVRDYAARGVLTKTKRGKYRITEAVPQFCAHLRALATGKGNVEGAPSGSAERARLAREQADAIALKNAVARGGLLDAAATEREWTSILAGVRAGVLAASSRIGQRLPQLGLSDIAQIDEELRAVLAELGGVP
jgi:terminase small subunit / prophage DNA-packing protein